jgi:hypothetical protein
MDEYLGAQKEYQKAVDNGFQGTYEEFLRYKSSGSFADGGRAKFQSGTDVITLNPLFPEKSTNFMSQEFKPIDVPGAIIPPLAIGAGVKRLKDIFFNETFAPDADEIEKTREEIRESLKPGEKKPIDTGPIKTGESTPPEIDTIETLPADTQKLPISTGGSEIPEQTLKDFIFYNKKAPIKKKISF